MITKLKTGIPKFTHILHIADIHIRLNKRHDEYREVFNELYEEIKNTPETTIVAILGDVFHSKSDLSPECVQMASDLFKTIANIRPTILIAGNHDATLSNKSRLDSLTPIVDALGHPNLHYLRDTGLYGMGNVLFNVMGVFDPPEKYIRGENIPAIYRNQYDHVVALFHGCVDRAVTDTGHSISNPAIMPPLFDHHDMALLGDIHKKQDMQDYDSNGFKPCIHYPGSMIQQNHGERLLGHGYSIWNLATRKYEFHELHNDYGYYTIEVHKGKLVTDLVDMPKKPRLRVKCFETIASEVKAVVAAIKAKAEVAEISYVRMDQEMDKKDIMPIVKDIVLNDLGNVEYQCKLINEYLVQKLQILDQSRIDDILKLNRDTNLLIKRDEFARNLKWKPIRFEFDNMFTYGEGNVIDFTKTNGVYGIFGPNRSGKSSILSALTFCLFDKFDRGFKGLHVRNIEKTSFRCKLEFEIAGVRYFIERIGDTTRTGNVKVNVRFWRVVNGVEEDLHGTARRDTNDVIRDYVGTYEDFILTALSVQTSKNNISFIDMGNTDRKDLLVQFIGLNVFDRLYEAAGTRNKEINALLKSHKDKNYSYEKSQYEGSLSQAKSFSAEETAIVESLRKQIADVNEQIVKETANLIKLDDNVPTNKESLDTRKSSAEVAVRQKKQAIEKLEATLQEREKVIAKLNEEIGQFNSSDLVESHKTHKTISDKIAELKREISLKKVEIKGKLEKVARLATHQYDPNCPFCVANEFVKDAKNAERLLEDDKKDAARMVEALNSLNTELSKYAWVEEAYQKYTKLLTDISKVKDEIALASRNLLIAKNDLEKLESALTSINQQVDLYNRNEIAVQHNEKISSNIGAFRNALTKLEVEYQRHNRTLLDITGKIATFQSKIQELTTTLEEVAKLEYEASLYQDYMAAVGRDGLPYQVICNTVPEIEREVNSILNQVVEYTIEFETDGKNVVPSIVYDQRKWPIEMSSGFERFVASIAIRVALTNISNLPKTTFLALDEGFGTLDADNLTSMFTLFSYLKNNFDFILVVSHIDTLKDAVDSQIEIKHEGNFSKVVFE